MLSHLKSLPVDTLKIDKGFVRELGTNPGDLAIVRAIIALAEAFGLELVAEGVETEAAATDVAAARVLPRAGLPAVAPGRRRRDGVATGQRADTRAVFRSATSVGLAVRLVQVDLQLTVDRPAGGYGWLRERLRGQQLDAAEPAGGLADQADPQRVTVDG